MNTDLLNRTKKQVLELLQNKFFQQADEIITQARKIYCDTDLEQLQVVSKIGSENWIEAENLCLQLCEKKPESANFSNLSIIQRNLKKNSSALQNAHKAVELNPNNSNFYANLSGVYWESDCHTEAFAYLDKAITLTPESHELHAHKAAYLFENNQVRESIESYKKAIKLQPNNPGYYVELFYCLASISEYEKAWPFYEYRYQSIPQVSLLVQHHKLPVLYERKNKYTENIAIVAEQGLGDTIMYLRFLEEFQEKAINSHFVCSEKNIINLLNNKNIRVKEKIDENDTHIVGLLSLPYHLNIKNIPRPFDLGQHMPSTANKKKIGIVWAGSAYHPMDSVRSTYLKDFATLYNNKFLQVIHFMTDLRKRKRTKSEEIIDYADGLKDSNILDLGSKCKTVLDTVEQLNNIDILVTVDTAIAHIAGSLGVPTYLLVSHVSDWRWKRFGDKSDWYESVEILRNVKNGSYSKLIEKVNEKIGGLMSPPIKNM